MSRFLCCVLALLCLCAIPAGAAVDDELSEYAAALARERGYQVGGQLSKGSGSGQFEVNSTSASTDRSLYVVEVYTTVAYEQNAGNTSNCHMDFSLFYLGPGELFGSNALIDHPKVMVSVAAISPAEAYLLSADRFWTHWQESGFPPQDLMAHFIRRITLLSDYICCSHFLEDDKRVAYFLHTCCASSGPSIPYTHEQIAAITGMSRVSVTRILKQFREAGILRQAYRRIEILDQQRLMEVFDGLGYFLD